MEGVLYVIILSGLSEVPLSMMQTWLGLYIWDILSAVTERMEIICGVSGHFLSVIPGDKYPCVP